MRLHLGLFGLVLAASGLLLLVSIISQVQANHPADFLDAAAACEFNWPNGHFTGNIIMVGTDDYYLVIGPGDLDGMDIRSTGRRDIIVSTDSEGVELSGGKGGDIICGGPGSDTLNGESGGDHLFGGRGNDTLNGGSGDDNLYGEGGEDFLNGGGSNDTLYGGDGPDHLWGGVGTSPAAQWPWLSPLMRGGSGDDVLIGGDGGDHLHGGSGDDVLIAGNEPDEDEDELDELYGGNHNDDLYGWGDDSFDGGWHQDYCRKDGVANADLPSCEKLTENTDYP